MTHRKAATLTALPVFVITLLICGATMRQLRADAYASLIGTLGTPLILPGYIIVGLFEKWVTDSTLPFHQQAMVCASAAFWALMFAIVVVLARIVFGFSESTTR